MIQGMNLHILAFFGGASLLLGGLSLAMPGLESGPAMMIVLAGAVLLTAMHLWFLNRRGAKVRTLKESEERLRLAIRGTSDGIYDWNLMTHKLYWSPQFKAMLGYADDELQPSLARLESMMHPEDRVHALDMTGKYLNREVSELSCVFRLRHKDGRWVWVQKRGRALFDQDGRAVRLAGTYSDVSSLKEYEVRLEEARDQAEKANAAKTEFLAHMSHEIRTPLTSISGVAEILMNQRKDFNTKQQQLIKVLSYSTIGLKELIDDILDFSKIESGQMELEEKPFDISELFQELISTAAVRAQEKGLKFTFDYSEVEGLHFIGDKARLRQIMTNLIGNALKFTHQGSVSVTARQVDVAGMPSLQIAVKDTGIGIDRQNFDLVFERFRQADPSVSRKYGGTGLGLAISRSLVVRMGGTIVLDSVLGQGSVFTVTIPLRLVAAGDHEGASPQKAMVFHHRKAANEKRDNILLVEDYEGNIAVLGYILESCGYDFQVARTGLQAVNFWRDLQPDLILMDVQMPEMDGFTATRQIRKIEQEQGWPRTPIIGMTAHAFVEDKDKCTQAGMDSYLAKPIAEADLVAEISRYLSRKNKGSPSEKRRSGTRP